MSDSLTQFKNAKISEIINNYKLNVKLTIDYYSTLINNDDEV